MRTLFPILLTTSILYGCRNDGPKEVVDTGPVDVEETGPVDADGDGSLSDVDCDDDNDSVYPGAEDICDGIDNDCDDIVDEDGETAWYTDADADGYGDAETERLSCEPAADEVVDATDCNDTDKAINPNADEICDGIDNDCDDAIDDDDDGVVDQATFYVDNDSDGYGSKEVLACEQPDGVSEYGGDCDDSDGDFNPGAEEDCADPTDYNCDGSVGYSDADGDGFAACEECNDKDAAINPDATELCDSADNDCDGDIDEDDASDVDTWYSDSDGDGFGDEDTT
ncbi:MAG: hypothetical protein ACI8RZ_003988, partial [Myxococcota bacterium]